MLETAVRSIGGERPDIRVRERIRLVRRTDYEFLTSAAARELIREQKIILIDYRLIQRAWTHGTSARPH